MSDLTEFLLARIAEDEAAANKCAWMFPSPWDVADRGWRVRIYAAEVPETGDHAEPDWVRHPVVMEVEPDRIVDDSAWLSERVEHVARHDPARVLAECEAKRRIVERCAPYDDIQVRRQTRTLAGDVLCALAMPFADHPDYREDWRP